MSINPSQELHGMYASDHAFGADPTLLAAIGADTRGDGTIGFHKRGLFDEADKLPDEATGNVETDEVDVFSEVEGITVVPDRVVLDSFKHRSNEAGKSDLADKWMKQMGYKWDEE